MPEETVHGPGEPIGSDAAQETQQPQQIPERRPVQGTPDFSAEEPESSVVAEARARLEAVGGPGPRQMRSAPDPEAAAVEAGGLRAEEASNALRIMMSCTPPPVEQEVFKVRRLTTKFRETMVPDGEGGERPMIPTPGKDDDPDDLRFHFWVELRGLLDTEIEELEDRAMRPPTPQERKRFGDRPQRDFPLFNRLLIATAMLNPDLRQLGLDMGQPERIVRMWFTPGEITWLSSGVNDLSGWDDGAVEKAKK